MSDPACRSSKSAACTAAGEQLQIGLAGRRKRIITDKTVTKNTVIFKGMDFCAWIFGGKSTSTQWSS